jgi:Cu/Ag efflux protein CusF
MNHVFRVSMATAVLLLLLDAPFARAESVEGQVKNVDEAKRVVTLEDGTKLAIPDNVQVDRKRLAPGARVKASYEQQEGEKVVTDMQVQPAGANR